MTYTLPPVVQASHEVALETVGVHLTPEFRAALMDGAREKIVYGGWRGGKSTLGAAEIWADIILRIPRKQTALYWLVGPDYDQTTQEYNYLADWAGQMRLVISNSAPLEGPRQLILRGGFTIETKSAHYTEKLGSVAPDLIVGCEAGQISDETRIWLRGRTMEKRARLIWTGTLEDEVNHAQWAWYIEMGSKWKTERTTEHSAYSLPSWANTIVYPGGRNDPEILAVEQEWRENTGADYTFLRRIAGEPTGVPLQVYPQLDTADLLRSTGSQPHVKAVGGIDFGTVHPSSHCIITVSANDIAWVRESTYKLEKGEPTLGEPDWIRAEKARLTKTWGAREWAVDPNERYMAQTFQAKAVSMSSREARVSLVTSRLNSGRLYFDANGPGVPALYEEMRHVHRKKLKSGEIIYDRVTDDRTAALEDAIEILDGYPRLTIPAITKRVHTPAPRREFARKF